MQDKDEDEDEDEDEEEEQEEQEEQEEEQEQEQEQREYQPSRYPTFNAKSRPSPTYRTGEWTRLSQMRQVVKFPHDTIPLAT